QNSIYSFLFPPFLLPYILFIAFLRNIFLYSLIQFFRRVITHLLLSVVNRRGLYDDRQITARTDRQRMTYDLVPQIFRIFLVKSQTVIFLISVPFLQLNDQIHRLGIFHTFHTKKRFYINDTDTAEFNKMTGNIRS